MYLIEVDNDLKLAGNTCASSNVRNDIISTFDEKTFDRILFLPE